MKTYVNLQNELARRDPMLYGHFIEHFHRQIYGGVYAPGHPLADEAGLRTDVLAAMRKIKVPVLRWPGGCFVSSYHWKDAVGPTRTPLFDKAWRVEDPNTFGTDEFVDFCRKVGCEPYICTNAGTGTAEEMSDWLEYCNLENQGRYARWRIANGHPAPHGVKYWSIGNENYGAWEIGAKNAAEWSELVREAAKMMRRVDPAAELSAAALTDLDWNVALLKECGPYLAWISVHQYWDALHQENRPATYEQCMAYTENVGATIDRVRGLLTAMGLENKIRIAFDEWNLRGWYHPNTHTIRQGRTPEEYLTPRDENDDNRCYTMADAVFSACFLNACLRNCDLVGMANFAPIVNTRGCIYTHEEGIVLRSTYHLFDLYVNYLGDVVLHSGQEETPRLETGCKEGGSATVDAVDLVATRDSATGALRLAAVNKDPVNAHPLALSLYGGGNPPAEYRLCTVNGPHKNAYNDVDRQEVALQEGPWAAWTADTEIALPPHSANVVQFR